MICVVCASVMRKSFFISSNRLTLRYKQSNSIVPLACAHSTCPSVVACLKILLDDLLTLPIA